MQRIVLEVDDSVGEIYSSLSAQGKQQFTETVSMMVKKTSNQTTRKDFMKLLDEVGDEAVKNGLTEEILEKLLSGND